MTGKYSACSFWLVALYVALMAPALSAEPFRFASGDRQTIMLELFTSEGCSSCPPAEEYLNAFRGRSALWQRYIPLAFHVDYWDYLGWPDRFALPGNATRQQRYANRRRLATVYTPAFVVNGQAWRPSGLRKELPQSTERVGNLEVSVERGHLWARFQPVDAAPGELLLHVALLGMGLNSQIQAGENRGRRSRHEFVVLARTQVPGDDNVWYAPLPTSAQSAPRYALVAWVSSADDPTPLQAAGAYLPEP